MCPEQLNPLASRVRDRLLAEFPEWRQYVGMTANGDLEVAVPAPVGSHAGHLVVFTDRGENLWVRFSPPNMCYPLDSEDEMLSVLAQLLRDEALFVVTRRGGEWSGTTLVRNGSRPLVDEGEVADVVSWSGRLDRTSAVNE
jgi:hypothetical protein